MDPSLCEDVSPTRLWTMFSWTIQYVLSRPLLVGLLLLAIAFFCRRYFRHAARFRKAAIALLLTFTLSYIAIASPLVALIGNRLLAIPLPADSGQPADAIVVLGRGPEQNTPRARVAVELWQEKRAPLIFSSGRRDALVMADLFRAQSVPDEAIAVDPCSLTTEQNAAFTAAALKPNSESNGEPNGGSNGVEKIILVTDVAHMWRSRLTFESFGFEVIPHITPLKENTSATEGSFLVIREALGLVSYGLMGRYAKRESDFVRRMGK